MVTVEAYYNVRAPLITISKIIGAELWTSDKLFQPASYYLMAHLMIYNVCNGFTIMTRGTDPVKLMQITILFATAFQLTFKFFYSIFKKYAIRKLFDLAEEDIYRRYSSATNEEKLIIEQTVRYLSIIWKTAAVMFSATLFVFGLWPIYVYYTEGQLVPLFFYEIPMVDQGNLIGYVVTLLFQVNLYVLGILGMIVADYTFIFVVFHALACIDLFVLHVSELTVLLTADKPEKDKVAIAEKWKCCIQDHQLTTRYLNGTEDFISLICLVQVFTCIYTICDAMLLTDWYAAFCFLIVIFGEMSIYFIIGNLIELKVDAMYQAVIDLPWNLLDVSQQKEYKYLLARSQRPLILTIFGFSPLNFESYMTVLRALYQFFVMIMQNVG